MVGVRRRGRRTRRRGLGQEAQGPMPRVSPTQIKPNQIEIAPSKRTYSRCTAVATVCGTDALYVRVDVSCSVSAARAERPACRVCFARAPKGGGGGGGSCNDASHPCMTHSPLSPSSVVDGTAEPSLCGTVTGAVAAATARPGLTGVLAGLFFFITASSNAPSSRCTTMR